MYLISVLFWCIVRNKGGSRGSPPCLHEMLKNLLIILEIYILGNICKQEHCNRYPYILQKKNYICLVYANEKH